jgi:thymidylate synthase
MLDIQYKDLILKIREQGVPRADRTGVGTQAIFGETLSHDMRTGFPLLLGKKVFWKSSVIETLWMLSGNTNINTLKDDGVNIWNEWADELGNLGPVYGHNWRGFGSDPKAVSDKWTLPNGGLDQIVELEKGLRNNPYSRRHLVSAWDPVRVPQMKLPPCHVMWQVFVIPETKEIDLLFHMRSVDVFLGLPWDIAMYGFILEMLGATLGYKPRFLKAFLGDTHLYDNHKDAVNTYLNRDITGLSNPVLEPLLPKGSILDFKKEDFSIIHYNPLALIKAPIAV